MGKQAARAGWAIGILMAASAHAVLGGELDPPAGAVAPTMKDLNDVEPRQIIRNDFDGLTPIVISSPGSYYLGEEILAFFNNHGIEINASNVTLDLNGFSVVGNTEVGSFDGIHVTGQRTNITIRNGRVEAFFQDGIDLGNAENTIVSDVTVAFCGGDGIHTGNSALIERCVIDNSGDDGIDVDIACIVRDCVVTESATVGVRAGSNSVVTGCTASFGGSSGFLTGITSVVSRCNAGDNGSNGFSVSFHCNISDCIAEDNGGNGFDSSSTAFFRDCVSQNNDGNGFDVGGTSGAKLDGCFAVNNGGNGIDAATDTHISRSTARSNSLAGIVGASDVTVMDSVSVDNEDGAGIALGSGNVVRCTVRDNSTDGISLSSGGDIRDCIADNNGEDGIVCGFDTTIVGCTAYANSFAGIHVDGQRCFVDSNRCRANTRGIDVDQVNNTIIRNVTILNGTPYSIVGGNDVATIRLTPVGADPFDNLQH